MDKKCKKCELIKDVSEFPKNSAVKGGLENWCKACKKEYYNNLQCKENHSKSHRKYRSTSAFKRHIHNYNLKKRYGITREEYDIILTDQGLGCAICGYKGLLTAKKNLSVDHNHETGTVRGLLCQKCNTGLGNFQDDPEIILKALTYLTKDHKCRPTDNPQEAKECTNDEENLSRQS